MLEKICSGGFQNLKIFLLIQWGTHISWFKGHSLATNSKKVIAFLRRASRFFGFLASIRVDLLAYTKNCITRSNLIRFEKFFFSVKDIDKAYNFCFIAA